MTEQGSAWVPELLDRLDDLHAQMVRDGRIGELGLEADVILPLKPSDYFRRQVYIGASFPSPSDAAVFHDIGLDHVMWGSDYPHHEACWPYSRESLRRTFAGWSEADLRQVLAGTAASVYGFDLDLLAPIAAEVGPDGRRGGHAARPRSRPTPRAPRSTATDPPLGRHAAPAVASVPCCTSTGNGGTRRRGRRSTSTNPATGEVIGRAADAGVDDVQAAIEAADAAFGVVVDAHRVRAVGVPRTRRTSSCSSGARRWPSS